MINKLKKIIQDEIKKNNNDNSWLDALSWVIEKIEEIKEESSIIYGKSVLENIWNSMLGPQSKHDVEKAFVSFYGKEALEKWKKDGGHTATPLMRKIYEQENKLLKKKDKISDLKKIMDLKENA